MPYPPNRPALNLESAGSTVSIESFANRSIVLRSRPVDSVNEACFAIVDGDARLTRDGEVLVRNIYLSCDPYMRGQLNASGSYKAPFALGAVIPARTAGTVEASPHPGFEPGDLVWGFLGWELFSVVDGGAGLRHIAPGVRPIPNAISVLGMPGLTAVIGVEVCAPRPGPTFYISAASGAVGQVAGQLAALGESGAAPPRISNNEA